MKQPRYFTPDEKSGSDYFTGLLRYNFELKQAILEQIATSILDIEHLAICTPGSDGRDEKSPGYSRAELAIITDDAHFTGTSIFEQIQRMVREDPEEFHQDIEIKTLGKTLMNCYAEDKTRIFPTRIADSAFIFGNESLYCQAKLKLVEEWLGPDGAYIVDRSANKRKESRKVLRDGGTQTYRQKNVKHYNLDEKWAAFDPENYILGFKAGPLRAVQTGLMHQFIKYCRESKAGQELPCSSLELINNLPRGTCERIDYFSRLGIVSASHAASLAQIYNEFLYHYHRSEYASRTNKETKITIPDLKEQEKTLCSILDSLK